MTDAAGTSSGTSPFTYSIKAPLFGYRITQRAPARQVRDLVRIHHLSLAGDQRYQAYRIQSTGTGVMIPPETLDRNLHTGIDKVINDPTYRSDARRTEIGKMPSADEVVPLIEQLANHGPPLPNR